MNGMVNGMVTGMVTGKVARATQMQRLPDSMGRVRESLS